MGCVAHAIIAIYNAISYIRVASFFAIILDVVSTDLANKTFNQVKDSLRCKLQLELLHKPLALCSVRNVLGERKIHL
jgi:hypothetical protein